MGSPLITLHVAASLDGFIARPDDTVSWLEGPEDVYPAGKSFADVDFAEVLASIDAYVMGSRTYEHALQLGWPYGDTPVLVLTSRELNSERESVEFHAGDLDTFVAEVLAPRFGSVWLVGGAELCQAFLKTGRVDRLLLTVAPVTLGGGLRLFGDDDAERRWRLEDVTAFQNGFVELTYAAEG